MTEQRWKVSSTAIFNINYHLIWVTKYRRKLLTDDIAVETRRLIYAKAMELGLEIKELEVMSDHIHIFVSSPPNLAPHYIVQQLKGCSSRILRGKFPILKQRLPSLWTRSYYCESVGHISEETVKKYIENQKGRDA